MKRRKFIASALAAGATAGYATQLLAQSKRQELNLSENAGDIYISLDKNYVAKNNVTDLQNNSIPLSDWIYGNIRSFFLYLDKNKISAINNSEPVDVTVELNRAMQDGVPIFLPNGEYIITNSINVGITSGLVGAGAKNVVIDNRGNDHAFIFPIGYDRGTKDFFGFSLKSSTGSAKDKYAFYFSSAPSGKLEYSVGWRFIGIELEGKGMGGGWYLQDCFRVTIRDCGASALSNGFYLAGSVVQLTVDNFVNNGDNHPETTLGSYGVYMGTKKYNDGNGIKMPEGINFINCKFVRQDIGVRALGLYVQFVNTEFDYCSKIGGLYAGGDKVDFINCYVASTASRHNDFYAFIIQAHAPHTPEPILVSNCTINMQKNKVSGYKSYGVLLSGGASFLSGARVDNCFFRGDGYENCIFANRVDGVIINNNTFRVKGENIKIESAKNLTICNNYALGNYSLPKPGPAYCWIITGNSGSFSEVDLSQANSSLIINQGLFKS
ncbi:hypothetical protein [Klebsiella oxytoca]|uniref:hypothetical protein n=1 Tax=Klebsiella oxytoca TaxID=571 RepID=UPI001F1E8C35|nr:hypothetical protein [Klebsiella oxytoca]UIM63012.1 hypothetical protein LXH16_13325 [Klebsiella oxytoca]